MKLKFCSVQVPVSGWLEGINAHPRLGDKAAMDAKRNASVSTIQVATASEQDELFKEQGAVLDEVLKWNEDYEAKFGHVFLLFAHGKRMADILEHVKARCALFATTMRIMLNASPCKLSSYNQLVKTNDAGTTTLQWQSCDLLPRRRRKSFSTAYSSF